MCRSQRLSNKTEAFSQRLAQPHEEAARIVEKYSDTVYDIEVNDGMRIPNVHVSELRPLKSNITFFGTNKVNSNELLQAQKAQAVTENFIS